jgi:hypothetical protein
LIHFLFINRYDEPLMITFYDDDDASTLLLLYYYFT